MDQCDQKQLFDRFCVEQFKDRDDKTSKTISREKGQRIVNAIKKDPSAVTYSSQFKFWVKKKRFELINHPALKGGSRGGGGAGGAIAPPFPWNTPLFLFNHASSGIR